MSVDHLSISDDQWLAQVRNDPEFQRLYAAFKSGTMVEDPQRGAVQPSWALNQYINRIGLPKGRSFTVVNGEPSLKDRTSAWSKPLMAAAAAGTLGVAAFAPGAFQAVGSALSGGGGGGAAAPAAGAAPSATTAASTAGGGVGLWGNIAKYGKEALKFGDKYGSYLDTAGDVFGDMAGAMGQNRSEEANFGLQAARDYRDARDSAYRGARAAAYDKNVQDVTFDRSGFHSNVPTLEFKGGRRPSAYGQEGRDAADTMYRKSMGDLENAAPAEIPKMSFWERLAGGAALGAKFLGNQKKKKPMGYQNEEGLT